MSLVSHEDTKGVALHRQVLDHYCVVFRTRLNCSLCVPIRSLCKLVTVRLPGQQMYAQLHSIGQNKLTLCADISLKDIGLDTFQNPLFLRLLGNSAVFLFSVIQFRSFFTKTDIELDEWYHNYIDKSARLQTIINLCKRFLVLHSQKFTAVTIFVVALSPISAINFVYLLLVLALLPFTNGMDTAGFFLMTYSMVGSTYISILMLTCLYQILLLAQMIYQFPARVYIANTQLMEWIGLFLHPSTFYLVAVSLDDIGTSVLTIMPVGLRCHHILRHLVSCLTPLETRLQSTNEICKKLIRSLHSLLTYLGTAHQSDLTFGIARIQARRDRAHYDAQEARNHIV